MVRLFVGIFVPKDLKDSIIHLQDGIRKLYARCKFVEPENFHVNLSFLGEVSEDEVENIKRKLVGVCEKFEKFEVDVSGLKIIPNEKYIRVLALGIMSNRRLEELSEEIKKQIGGDVKPPHLTLCRINYPVDDKEKFVSELGKINWSVGKFIVSSVSLVKSIVTGKGPTYTSLHDCWL